MDEAQMMEAKESTRNMAAITRHYYLALIDEGFTETDALRLTQAWVKGVAGGTGTD